MTRCFLKVTDVHSVKIRSKNMAAIKNKDTKPELLVRKGLHARGFRFRLNNSLLPGRPDIVLPKYRVAIFVNGCFWHVHECPVFKWPASREQWWRDKLTRNRIRDKANTSELINLGWRVCVVWECSLKGKHKAEPEAMFRELSEWICSQSPFLEIEGSWPESQP